MFFQGVRCQHRPWTYRPYLEVLESRTLLSVCTVDQLSDMGAGQGDHGDLRYCINWTNDHSGPDTITFAVTGTIYLESALPHVSDDLRIAGPGEKLLKIDAQQKARVFYVDFGVNASISSLTLTHGLTSSGEAGGAIYNAGNLVIENCTIADNSAWAFGGGIYNGGTLSISTCSISGNQLQAYFGAGGYYTWGGGIYNDVNGVLLINNSLISTNKIQYHYSWVALGAGIANRGKAVVVYSTISENSANPPRSDAFGGSGGGIFNSGNLLVDSSLISMNIAAGGIWGEGGGICNGASIYSPGSITISNSTIANNVANTTGLDNPAQSAGGGVYSMSPGTVIITNSTIAGNKSLGKESYKKGYGGGISATGVLQVHNSIVAGNEAKTSGNDLYGALTSSGYNLFGNSTGGSGYDQTDLLNVDPLLGPVADNGGPTKTMAVLPGSPAIDAGDNTGAPEWDQRGPGYPRIVNGIIDIGAFEVQQPSAIAVFGDAGKNATSAQFSCAATSEALKPVRSETWIDSCESRQGALAYCPPGFEPKIRIDDEYLTPVSVAAPVEVSMV
jgi:hypothetical protein